MKIEMPGYRPSVIDKELNCFSMIFELSDTNFVILILLSWIGRKKNRSLQSLIRLKLYFESKSCIFLVS